MPGNSPPKQIPPPLVVTIQQESAALIQTDLEKSPKCVERLPSVPYRE